MVETTELSGALEQELRSSYAGLDAAGLRSHLEEDRGGIALIVSGVGNGTSSRRGHHH